MTYMLLLNCALKLVEEIILWLEIFLSIVNQKRSPSTESPNSRSNSTKDNSSCSEEMTP